MLDLLEFTGPEVEIELDCADDDLDDNSLLELDALLQQVDSQPQPGPSGAALAVALGAPDNETGVLSSDSAMAYVAGYVARKRPADRSLGAPSASAQSVSVAALWTRLISFGRLTVPTEDFYSTFKEMNSEFCVLHALETDGLSCKPGVTREVSVLTKKFPHLHPKVISSFARVRTFIRMNAINSRNRARRAESREAIRPEEAALCTVSASLHVVLSAE